MIESLPGENWLPVPGYEGLYDVSDQGRVRSVDRRVSHSGTGAIRLKGRLISQNWAGGKNGRGCLTLYLHNQGRNRAIVPHLVMLAFVGPRPAGLEVLHEDDNPANNHISNLRYGTHSENMIDRRRNGNDRHANQTHCIHGHEFTPENTYVPPAGSRTKRYCKTCVRRWKRDYRRRLTSLKGN